MGWADREYIPVLEQDWRYTRLLQLTRQLLCEQEGQETTRMFWCPHCQDGKITVDGHSVDCGACAGTGDPPAQPADSEEDRDDGHHGEAAGGRWPVPHLEPAAVRMVQSPPYRSTPITGRPPQVTGA
ncbi:hypothetical protein [Streptomyces sp. NPDC026589]|uniref:hypothetical protein n=1 Tax=Streptomyces sp. NPDC026589 TaxID=3155609 RepID=UPI0034111702